MPRSSEGGVYPRPTNSGQDTKQIPRSSEGGVYPRPTNFPMLKAIHRFVIPFYPGNLTERIVHPGQHGVPFRYPILTRLNNVSIQLAMTLYSMINWHS